MSKVTAPLLSFSASGQIGKAQVYGAWKGRQYARRYTIPANPQSAEQTLTRNTFSWLNNIYRYMPTDVLAAWAAYADNLRITDRNAFLKRNVGPMRDETDLLEMTISPSARAGIVAAGITVTPANDALGILLTAPTLPAGWTIARAVMVAIEDQDPQTDTDFAVHVATDSATPFDQTISGLKSAVTYLVGGFFVFNRPDGLLAYGESLQTTGLTT